jgi:regulator of protease activity HflC (stomatin/prohibitin superfamily)
MDLDQLLSHRDDINERLLRVMDAAASPWGVKVTRIEIKDIMPPPAIAEAMTRQMRAEREKRANVLEAEGLRQAAILRAEGEKQAQILAAEGRKEAAFRDAEARERQAQAEAMATGVVSSAIAAGDPAAVNFLVAEKYVDAFRTLAASPNQRVVVVPYEMGGLVGTLSGIAEIGRQVFGEGRDGAARPTQARRPGSVPPAGA